MHLVQLTHCLAWAAGIGLVSAAASPGVMIRTRDTAESSSADTLRAFHSAVVEISRREVQPAMNGNISIAKSWDGATLFSYHKEIEKENAKITADVNVACTSCYLKAQATAELSIDKSFNASMALHNVADNITDTLDDIAETALSYTGKYLNNTWENLQDGISLADFEPPPMDVDFNIEIPDMPECRLKFSFDGLELYMMLDSKLSANITYNLNLYSSKTPIGISVGKDTQIGVVFTVDLILSAEAEVDIRSGFHIKLDDGASFSLAMFADNLTDTTFDGGKFEFLPVTVQSAGGVLKAVLRLGAEASIEAGKKDVASAGIGVRVFAHVAEFVTNITAPSISQKRNDHDDCVLRVEESYQLAIGAAAGASIAIKDKTWGPNPETVVPLYYTTLAEACATSPAPAVVTTASVRAIRPRGPDGAGGGLTTTTLTTKDTFTGVACQSTELINCPASLQKTTTTTKKRTLVTAVPSGVQATFPATTYDAVPTTVDFGSHAKKLHEVSGSPTSFVPDPTSVVDKAVDAINGANKRIIIGVSVGVGSFVILAVSAGCWLCLKRRKAKYQPVSRVSQVNTSSPDEFPPSAYDPQKMHKTHHITTTIERDGR